MISGFKHCFLEAHCVTAEKKRGETLNQKRYLRKKIGVSENKTTGIGNVLQMKAV